jgi:DNA primase
VPVITGMMRSFGDAPGGFNEELKEYNIIICLDNDKAGIEGGCNMFKILTQIINNKNIKFVNPHKEYKDFNEMFINEGPNVLKHYIINNQKYFDLNSPMNTIEDYIKLKLL